MKSCKPFSPFRRAKLCELYKKSRTAVYRASGDALYPNNGNNIFFLKFSLNLNFTSIKS